MDKSRAFLEQNYPTLYLHGKNESADDDETAAKVRIQSSRERDDKSRTEKNEGGWMCKIVGIQLFDGLTITHTIAVQYRQFSRTQGMFQVSNPSCRYEQSMPL